MTTQHYLPAPQTCEKLEDLVPRFGGTLESLPSISGQTYSLPPHASEEFHHFFRNSCIRPSDKNLIARMPGGRVFGSGCVLSPDGKSIARDVSLDFGKSFTEHWLLGFQKIHPPVPHPGTSAVIATNLGFGYSHWLLEELPRLISIRSHSFDRLIAHNTREYNRKAFELAGFSGEVLDPVRYSHLSCETLLIPSLTGKADAPSSETLQLINDFVSPLRKESSPCGEKIYLSREKAKRRRVTNESTLFQALEGQGFVKVHVEDLTWKEQINLFRQSKVIVSPHGAALANLVFCRPGTKVIECFNRSYINGGYWRLASAQGLDYHPVFPSSKEPLSDASTNNRLDIEADISACLSFV